MSEARARARALGVLASLLRGETTPPSDDDARAWHALLELGAQHGLLPALWAALRDSEQVAALPGPARAAIERYVAPGTAVPRLVLQDAYEANGRRNEALVGTAVAVLDELGAAGIEALPLKGMHGLLGGLWDDPAVRVMADIDLLVPPDRGADAFAVLLGVGFVEDPHPIGEHADHHLALLRGADGAIVELHVAPLVSRWNAMLGSREVWAAARHDSHGRLRMSDTHAVIHLVAHAQLQDDTYQLCELPLQALYEMVRWSFADSVDWDGVHRRFVANDCRHVLDAHLDAAHRLFGAAIQVRRSARTRAHGRLTTMGVRYPRLLRVWRQVPRSFTRARMLERYGPARGPLWLTRNRLRHASARLTARVRNRDWRR